MQSPVIGDIYQLMCHRDWSTMEGALRKMAECHTTDSSCILDSMVYDNDQMHQSELLENLKSLYDNQQLVDVTICVQHRDFLCHRNVLAATSPYFKAMFTTALTESTRDRIDIYEVDNESFELVLGYAYSGRVEITKANAQNLLAAASLFQIAAILKACARFMEMQLDVSNCIGIHYFAQVHDCSQLTNKAREHIEKNFVEVSRGDEFLSLTPDKVGELLVSNELNVEREESVFEALMKWVQHNEAVHLPYLSTLLPHIRFGLISKRYIQDNIASHKLIVKCTQCQHLLQDIQAFEANPEGYQGEHIFSVILRSGMIKPEHCILLIGGVDQNRPSINCFNPLTREAYYLSEFQGGGRLGYYDVEDPACIVTDDNLIFVAGGNYVYHENFGESPSDEDSFEDYEEETVRKDFFQYDNDHNCWQPRAPMLFPKSNFALAYVDGNIYCFGGLTVNQHPTEIIERYDVALNRWSYVGMMPTTLVDLTAVVFSGQIYILGGRTGVGAHNVVMRYDPHRAEWTSLAGMPTPRFNFGACVYNEEIYVAGGQIYSHTSHTINREALRSVEIYCMEQNQWRQGPELPEDIYNVGLFVINGIMYGCGTTEYYRSAYRIYRYNVVYRLDMVKSVWNQVESDLCDIRDYACIAAKMHTRKLSQVFRPDVDT